MQAPSFRAFVGIEVGAVPGTLPLLREVGSLAADLKVVSPENLHVTLAFLGTLSRAKATDVRAAIETASRGEAAFEMRLAGAGVFPPRGAPRVLWIGLVGADPLVRIAARLRPLLAALGARSEDRPFVPHLTLARAKSPRGADSVRAFAAANATRDVGSKRVEAVTLYSSTLAPGGPVYEPVERVSLGGAT